MRAAIMSWRGGPGWTGSDGQRQNGADLVFYFGASDILQTAHWYDALTARFPSAHLIGCSMTLSETVG
jgi:hypothetical protein